MPVFPIYRSTDNGNSWTKISEVADTQNGWGMRWQPELFELPRAMGGFPAGTILAAGSLRPRTTAPPSRSTLYASTDRGQTWTFVTNIATGGAASDTNGNTPVWEPFFLVSGDKLIVYYSDQRDPDHGQKIVHQVSTDLRNWGPVVDDVAMPTYSQRPGMPTVTRLPNGNYVMTYEYGGAPEGNFAVYYKISSDPEAFNSVTGIPLRSTDGEVPTQRAVRHLAAHRRPERHPRRHRPQQRRPVRQHAERRREHLDAYRAPTSAVATAAACCR